MCLCRGGRRDTVKLNDTIKVSGELQLYEYKTDAPKEEVYAHWRASSVNERLKHLRVDGKNLIVNGGLNSLMNLTLAINTTSWGYCAVGTSGAANSATATALGGQLSVRRAIGSRYAELVGKAHFDTTFGGTENNGTWQECGLFLTSAGADMLARKIIDNPVGGFIKGSGNSVVAAWTIIFAATGT